VSRHRLVAVDRLQHQVVGDFGARAAPARGYAASECLAPLVQQPVQLTQKRCQHRRGRGPQHGGDEPLVQHDLPVGAALDDSRERYAGVLVEGIAFDQELRTDGRDFHHRGLFVAAGVIADLDLRAPMTRDFPRAVGPPHVERSRTTQGQGEEHRAIASRACDLERRRNRIVVGHAEGGAVGQHATRATHRNSSGREQVALQLELRKAPAPGVQGGRPDLELALDGAFLLLEVLWPQEQAFTPYDPVVDGHPVLRTLCVIATAQSRHPR
jgi:hypothetical protein